MTTRPVRQRTLQSLRELASAGLDVESFWRAATCEIERVIEFDWRPCWFTLDPDSLVATSHFNEDIDELDAEVFTNEYVDEDVNKMADLAIAATGIATLARATAGDRRHSRRYRDLLSAYGMGHEMVAVLRADGRCWGALTLYRAEGCDDFSDDDLAWLGSAGSTLAEGARRALIVGEAHETDATSTTTSGAPAVLVLDAALELVSMTTTGDEWLFRLTGSRERLPSAVRSVAAAALDPSHGSPSARLRTRAGDWTSLHAAPMGDSQVAVIVSAASADQLGPLLMAAYGLSDREQTVVRHVLNGASTDDVAASLHLSPYTVQDHLKTIFDKTGVRTRRQLLARVFFDHYEPRVRDNERRVLTGRYIQGGALRRGAEAGSPEAAPDR